MISAGCFGGWIVDVSAVDTGPRGSESGFLVAQPAPLRCGAAATAALRPASSAAPPGSHHVTNVMTSNIELYLAPARRPRRPRNNAVPGPDPHSFRSTNVHEGGAELVRRGACGGRTGRPWTAPSDRPTHSATADAPPLAARNAAGAEVTIAGGRPVAI